MSDYDVTIVSGGAAGLTAGLYAARAGLKSLLLERGIFGGQMANTRLVENYPRFSEGNIQTESIIIAAGDVRHHSAQQAITAAGDGATAASSAFKYLYE